MASFPSSVHTLYKNKNFMKSSKEFELTDNKRSRNTAFNCRNLSRDKPWAKYQYVNFAVCEESGEPKFDCEAKLFEPTISDKQQRGNEKLPCYKRKVIVSRVLGPQKVNMHSQLHFFSDHTIIHICTWYRQRTFLQAWKAIRSTNAWLINLRNEASSNYSQQTTMATIFLLWILWFSLPAYAADPLETYTCLVEGCRLEVIRCVANPACAANLACIETCNNRPDATDCQMKCGDLFENSVVDQFNQCAISQKKCVPQKKDEGTFPVPNPCALVKKFNIADFSGKWYISSGLNPLFDTFDCQISEFYPTSKNLRGKLSWRISTPFGGFFTRYTNQRFVQDLSQPGVLHNHDNEYLHYQDNWYILSSKIENKPDDYIFVYYRGKNDAWEGYGGAVVYTRNPVLPSSIVPALEKAAGRVGLNFKNFTRTDNMCGPEPPLLAILQKKFEEGELAIAKEVENIEKGAKKVARIEMALLQRLGKGIGDLRRMSGRFLEK